MLKKVKRYCKRNFKRHSVMAVFVVNTLFGVAGVYTWYYFHVPIAGLTYADKSVSRAQAVDLLIVDYVNAHSKK